MDLTKLIKDSGADKPKQTRPNDVKWDGNMIQYKLKEDAEWHFWRFSLDYSIDCPKQFGFVDGILALDELRDKYPAATFRLVAVMEVK